MYDELWIFIHSGFHSMKTIQMTIDDHLLLLVDQMPKARRTTRSAFIRDALGHKYGA